MAAREQAAHLRLVEPEEARVNARPSPAQQRYLKRGLAQPGGKLPLYDLDGQAIDEATVRACIDRGWAEPWVRNPLKPDSLICKLTPAGRDALGTG